MRIFKETADVLMCWSTIFTSATAQYDPTKCKVSDAKRHNHEQR